MSPTSGEHFVITPTFTGLPGSEAELPTTRQILQVILAAPFFLTDAIQRGSRRNAAEAVAAAELRRRNQAGVVGALQPPGA